MRVDASDRSFEEVRQCGGRSVAAEDVWWRCGFNRVNFSPIPSQLCGVQYDRYLSGFVNCRNKRSWITNCYARNFANSLREDQGHLCALKIGDSQLENFSLRSCNR